MTSTFNPALYTATPGVTVLDSRGLTVRELAWDRTEAGGENDTRITRHHYDTLGHLVQSIDPRLHAARQQDKSMQPNFCLLYDLAGNTLRSESCDAGCNIALSDCEGRPVLTVNANRVKQTQRYENTTLPGRLLAVMEQLYLGR